jgi:CRP-like cAMP-binding protein
MSSPKAATWQALKEITMFQNLNDTEIKELYGLGQAQNFEAYANVIIEGEQTSGMYLLMNGTAGVFKTDRVSGKTYDICQLREGSIFGEFSLVDDQPRSANIRTLTDCELLYFPKEKFSAFLQKQSDRQIRFYEGSVRALVWRLRELDQEFVQSQYQLWETALKVNKEAV